MEISVIIPVYNEAENVEPLYEKLAPVMQGIDGDHEIIFVDDGSRDTTFEVLRKLKEKGCRIKAVQLRKNYGKSKALLAGFEQARGDIIATLDGDLQDEPGEIPGMIKLMEEGYDLVNGWRRKRRDPFGKVMSSKFFNLMTRLFTGVKLHDFNCGMRVFRKEAVDDMADSPALHRFLPAIVSWNGYRVTELAVEHSPRVHGKSKYGVEKVPKGFGEFLSLFFLVRYTSRPLIFILVSGLLSALSGFGILAYLTCLWFKGRGLSSRPLLHLGILLLLIGVQLLLIALIVGITVTAHKREKYIIKSGI
ncbi:MAG: glycosyltransferase family 2 protein [Elusimicrobia bacterium]|nr:glycosyltransferase family 2 protein [Elusimicrobiota bacterium]